MKTIVRSHDAFSRRFARRWVVASALLVMLIGIGSASFGSSIPRHPQLNRVTTIAFVGHGWGPGVGMGQWGAFGYAARYHFGYERILNHYYGGTTAATLSSVGESANPTISVLISENLNLATNIGYDPIVTSAVPFTVTSDGGSPGVPTTSTTPTTSTSTSTTINAVSTTTTNAVSTTTTAPGSFSVPAGTAVDLRLTSNGTWNAYEGSTCALASAATSSAPVATGLTNPVVDPTVAPTAPLSQLLVLCRHDGVDEPLRGSVEAYDRSGYERTLNLVPLESYLQGVVPSESSASWGNDGGSVGSPQGEPWGFQALEAQAVAARSYAVAYASAGGWNGYADICDTTSCQVYTGASYETTVSNAAVVDTPGEIRVRQSAPSVPLSTQYSASTGGYTAPSSFGVVHDLGDACVAPGIALECNPNHTWQIVVDASVVTKHYPSIGRLLSVHVATRTGAGAYGGRALTVILSGEQSTMRVSGDAFSAALGLKSDWFAVAHLTRAGSSTTSALTTTTSTTMTSPATTSTIPTTPSPTTTTPTSTSSSTTTTAAILPTTTVGSSPTTAP